MLIADNTQHNGGLKIFRAAIGLMDYLFCWAINWYHDIIILTPYWGYIHVKKSNHL